MTPSIADIFVYPVKSTHGISLSESRVLAGGLEHDRRWAVADEQNVILTAREYPALFGIRTEFTAGTLSIHVPGAPPVFLPSAAEREKIPVSLFGNTVHGHPLAGPVNANLTAYLNLPCRLIHMEDDTPRTMSPRYGGSDTDPVSYADTAPFLLVSEASLAELNGQLPQEVDMQNFRPNLVVKGCAAGEEDRWQKILIGDVILEQTEACKRCVMTTLDPLTGRQHPGQEPLRTLATYRRHARGGVRFGINLVPRVMGLIRRGDRVEVLEAG